MITGSIARRWAKALFAIGEEQGTLIGLVREVGRASDAWMSSEELRTTLTNPMLDPKLRKAVWEELIRKLGATRLCKNFLNLLIEKNRLTQLPDISRELQVLADEKDKRVRAEVIGAVPVASDVVNRLKVSIQRTTGKMAVVTTSQDPELIGGIVTRVGGLMFDGSVRTQLDRMKEGMLQRG